MSDVIKSTRDYEKFKIVEGNRVINPKHLTDLTLSIMKKNMLDKNPIIVNEKMEVIDGQHRLEVAKNNHLEVHYIVLPGAQIEEVIQLNASNKTWTAIDYVNSYVNRGYRPYMWLRTFCDNYKIAVTTVCYFLYGRDARIMRVGIKNGTFNPTEEQKEMAAKRADVYWDILPYLKNKGRTSPQFLKALMEFIDMGFGKKLVSSIQKRGMPFFAMYSYKDAKAQLEEFLK